MSRSYRRPYRAFARSLAVLFAVFSIGATLPVPQPAKVGKPIAAEQNQPKAKANTGQIKRPAKPVPGWSALAPLYVKTACDHGCGYAESREGWWERLETDPVATFTAILALLTILLSYATIKAANAATAAAELVPALERAYVYFEIVRSHVAETVAQSINGNWQTAPNVIFRMINYGKTPAVVKEMSFEIRLQKEMHAPKFASERLETERILSAITTDIPEGGNRGLAEKPTSIGERY